MIEDNAIYFDNFSKNKNKKYFSGSLGDYSIYSFNIMKNISSFTVELYPQTIMSLHNFILERKKIKKISIFLIIKTNFNFFYTQDNVYKSTIQKLF